MLQERLRFHAFRFPIRLRLLFFLSATLLTAREAHAQIFGSNATDAAPPTVLPAPGGISAACSATFNNTVSCYEILPDITYQGRFPSANDLYALCNTQCLQSLESFRSSQLSPCSSDIVTFGTVSYPATVGIDMLIFTYNYTCRIDATTKAFCAPLVDHWGDEPSPTANESCSDCVLGTLQMQLDSPLGYAADSAKNFSSMTSSCGASNYPVNSPTPYTLTATVTTKATPTIPKATPACNAAYTVKAGDTCNSISIAHNVSTFDLLYENGLEGFCANFPSAGRRLCLPHQCNIYTVQPNDTCYGITQTSGNAFTVSQIISWNINLNRDCSNLDQLVGSQLCISFPGELALSNTSLPSTTAISQPPNLANGTNTNCARYYNVSIGDYCSSVTVQEGISLQDFYFLNPEINSTTCGNLLLGESYCVQAVGDISTYPGYGGVTPTGMQDPCRGISAPASCFATTYMTAAYWTWPSDAAKPTATTADTPATLLPLASGTLTNCSVYDRNYKSSTAGNQTHYNINGCWEVARFHAITTSQLVTWNPSLNFNSKNPDSCVLSPGYRYCVGMNGTSTVTTSGSSTTAQQPASTACSGGTPPPEQTQSGIPCWCNKWAKQQDGKYCQDMANDAGITLDQLYMLNPPLKGDCSGLYVGYSNCIGPPPAAATTTPVLTTPNPTCAGGTPPPEQTQPGIPCKCDTWVEQQSGKYCQDMASAAGITLQRLYDLNPALKGDCSGLHVGYAYCVNVAS